MANGDGNSVPGLVKIELASVLPASVRHRVAEPSFRILKSLDSLVGLRGVKEEIRNYISYLRYRQLKVIRGLEKGGADL